MEADPWGDEAETCPKCGKEMVQFQRRAARMFGGGGVGEETSDDSSRIGQPDAGH
jgi:hypothetical protein